MVINPLLGIMGSCRLYNVDVLAADCLLNLASTLANLELGQYAVAFRNSEYGADVVDEGRVGVAPKDHNVADHLREWLYRGCPREVRMTEEDSFQTKKLQPLAGP